MTEIKLIASDFGGSFDRKKVSRKFIWSRLCPIAEALKRITKKKNVRVHPNRAIIKEGKIEHEILIDGGLMEVLRCAEELERGAEYAIIDKTTKEYAENRAELIRIISGSPDNKNSSILKEAFVTGYMIAIEENNVSQLNTLIGYAENENEKLQSRVNELLRVLDEIQDMASSKGVIRSDISEKAKETIKKQSNGK